MNHINGVGQSAWTEGVAYPPLSDVPVVAKNYRPTNQVSLPYTYLDVEDNTVENFNYDFSLERGVLEEANRIQTERQLMAAAQDVLKRKLEADKLAKQRRQAPGLAVDGEIMQPTSASSSPAALGRTDLKLKTPSPIPPLDASALNSHGRLSEQEGNRLAGSVSSLSDSGRSGSNPSVADSARKHPGIDYLEFEQGLPPPDPWRTEDDDDDLRMLKEVMGVPESRGTSSVAPNGNAAARKGNAQQRWSALPTRNARLDALAGHHSVTSSLEYDDVVGRARALMADLGLGSQSSGPPPPPKPVGLQTNNPGQSSSSRKRQSLQYPILPGISTGSSAQNQLALGHDIPSGVPFDMRDTFLRITQMGFSHEAVERGIINHARDEKKILDFAIAFEEHRHAGFKGDDIQVAIGLYDHDIAKERTFLEAYTALAEFGFPRERIREALVMKNNDRDQALDYLMQERK
ncbi:uncharacterized protein SPPG_00856 [Spizellomyces punctatus DAOM BR117]|uniref:UBA domain-containing protein n=1 Tax=Spizellomyces punctatus (strain DAOM BR117) TaxID=645134 RepID=A0A0L0HV24_SPIPD|nr:uncharacterized protein SPPG_00856 [Spizellomyces punctatus DAOM BR117]KND05196.1 hypothetical protein SPPG_00856 [Spizellomyces punctatus DAOM BR117]|eukprot:XP_016613235.1 hypothetical protein SPPG_00856 [Spizellomyces punctatus DAOM BR117]